MNSTIMNGAHERRIVRVPSQSCHRRVFAGALCAIAALGFARSASAALIDRGGGLIYDDDRNITWLSNFRRSTMKKFPHRWAATALCVVALGVSSAANAALVSRLGGLAYYDTELNISWLQDANYAQTSGYDSDGRMNWADANAWAESLTIAGISGWRLPSADVNGDGIVVDCDVTEDPDACLDNEMGFVYWDEEIYASSEYPFNNVEDFHYWSGTEAVGSGGAWFFNFGPGAQDLGSLSANKYAWAVHSGDVGAVPVPAAAAVWLFGSGLLGLIGFARRPRATE